MDSISQMVLGAAVGEAVLGKKLGNKAMFWGAVGGTIPDLDIITSPFLSEVDSLAFHRGYSHSISFAIIGGLLFGWFCYSLYNSKYYRRILLAILSLFTSCIPVSIYFFLFAADEQRYYYAAIAIFLAIGIFLFLDKKHMQELKPPENVQLKNWQWMFFLAFFTHTLLDCFTMYGTQLFLPFSNYRVAIASVSVADPIGYTIPFLICVFIASRYGKENQRRHFFNRLGLGISTTYLIFTLWHKQKIEKVFKAQLAEQEIAYNRMILGPSIFQNFLWSATIESKEKFYQGQYSVFDTSPIDFYPIAKNHELIPNSNHDRTIKILKWFSNNYFNIIEKTNGKLQFNDLRFGTFRGKGDDQDYIFKFIIKKLKDGKYHMEQAQGGPQDGETLDLFKELFERVKGR